MKACLIGKTLQHSFSAPIHQSLGTDYSLVEVPENSLEKFVKSNWDCYNVTIPYKEKIIPLLDGLDDSARLVGAVNTVATVGGKRIGYNTDIDGLAWLFEHHGVSLRGKNVTVLGQGGTSKTTCALLKREHAVATVVGLEGKWNYGNYHQLTDTEILVNATPVGMYPNCGESLVDLTKFAKLQFVVDVIYNPLKTALLLQAEKLGIPFANGLEMLVVQAVFAEQIWQGKQLVHLSQQLIAQTEQKVKNLVLIGMPGCGKTTVGKLVAQMLDKPFVDLDMEIEKEQGCTVPQIFAQKGEAYFRKLENAAAAKFGSQNGLVIATGGGTPVSDANKDALRQNALVVWLQRDITCLAADNRPVSQARGVQTLFAERQYHYLTASDVSVFNNEDAATAAQQVALHFTGSCKH